MSKPHPLSLPIESLRPGTFADAHGEVWTFTEADIADLAAGYDAKRNPAPVVVGHPKLDSPAVGIISGASKVGEKLTVEIDPASLDAKFAADVQAKKFFRVSLRLFAPNHPANPNPGKWSIRHLGFLGAYPPAITGLAPVFAACDDAGGKVVDFASSIDEPWWSVGTLFRRLRDWMISKDGIDAADSILPDWQVASIETAAALPDDDANEKDTPASTPAFSVTQENTVTEQEAAALAAENLRLKAQLATANATAAAATKARRHDENIAFAASLVTDPKGPKLAPQQQSRVVALLDALGGMESEVEFATGDGAVAKESPAVALRTVLGSMATLVPVGAAAAGGNHDGDTDFASPADGAAERAELDRKARTYAKAHNVPYAEAVQACMSGAA